jgi:hypothetical protein
LSQSRGQAHLLAAKTPAEGNAALVTRDWLQNYRRNLKVILLGKGFKEDNIKFLPEPFAVFQYYRHGKKHPLVADRR